MEYRKVGEVSICLVWLVLLLFLLILIIDISNVQATTNSSENGSEQAGWLAFWILLIFFFIIIFMWIVTYIIMHGIIKHLELKLAAVKGKSKRRYDDTLIDSHQLEETGIHQGGLEVRRPKGTCTVCNQSFNAGTDAFRCKCKTFIHLHCLADLTLCPKCGAEISKVGGIIPGVTLSEPVTSGASKRKKIGRLLKPRLCSYCNKIIRAGDHAYECKKCKAVYHEKCNTKSKVCVECEN